MTNLNDPTPPAQSFEEAYAALEEAITRLESGELSLDESVALYAQGRTLLQTCEALLDAAELRITRLPDAD